MAADPVYDWRRLEGEARVMAASMTDPEAREVMLVIAAAYKRLADRPNPSNARRLIDGASFGPEALKTISEAFDIAWTEIGGHFGK